MLGKTERERKPRSRIVRQNRTTAIHLFLLQIACFVVCVSLFFVHASGEVEKTAATYAELCTVAIRDKGAASYVEQVMQLYQEALETTGNPEAGMDRAAIEAIEQDPGYQELVKAMNKTYSSDAYEISLVGYDQKNNRVVLVADAQQSPGAKSDIGATAEIPEEYLKRYLSGKYEKYTDHTLFSGSSLLMAVYAAYLVDGDPSAGFVFAVCTDSRLQHSVVVFALQYFVVTFLAILFIMYSLNKRTTRLLVKPLDTITQAIDDYSSDRSLGSYEGNHFDNLAIKTDNELETLADTLARMERDETAYVDKMAQVAAEKEREEAELRMATRIQESALPRTFPAFPDRPEFEIYASMAPAREVDGDFYDFFLVDDDHLCMVIADVSDKGIPAALFMMTSKTTIANHIRMGKSPAEALADTNRSICERNEAGMFVTVWVGILEISTGRLTAANAAHEYPALQRPHGAFALYRDRHSIMVGVMDDTEFTDYRMVLRPGSKLFVYTDGVPEATNADGAMFGLDRMVDVLNEEKGAGPEQVLDNMRRAVDEFVQGAPQFDDLTMLCLEYKGSK